MGGTSEVEARANDSRVVDVILLDTRGLIVGSRGSGDALITVRDVGLATPASASALVRSRTYCIVPTIKVVNAFLSILLSAELLLFLGHLCQLMRVEAS